MKLKIISVAGVALLAVGAGVASAHHSFAMFDRAQQVTLEGTVKEFQWTNPHTWTQLIVTQGGKQVEYGIEGGSPNGLSRRGWNKNSLKAGERVTIVINPLKDGQKGGSFVRATFPDGRTLTGQ